MTTTTTITLYHKGCEFDVDVAGYVYSSGSNSYGSDEPYGIYCDDVEYTNPRNGKRLSKRLTKWIESNHNGYAQERLVETYQGW